MKGVLQLLEGPISESIVCGNGLPNFCIEIESYQEKLKIVL